MTREPQTEGERERKRYRNAASNLLAFGFEAADDDYTALRCSYSPSGAERRGPKAMLRAAGHVDPGYVPERPQRRPELSQPELPQPVAASVAPRSLLGLVMAVQMTAAGPVAPPRAEEPVRWHIAPPGAEWTDHVVEPDGFCEAHLDLASRGEVPFGGHVEVQDAP